MDSKFSNQFWKKISKYAENPQISLRLPNPEYFQVVVNKITHYYNYKVKCIKL